MRKIPVGIVLIPEQKAIEKIVSLNNQLEDRSIALNVATSIPHITLAMAHVRQVDLIHVKEDLSNLKSSDMITITSISCHLSRTGKNLLWLDVKLHNELKRLHLKAMELRRSYHFKEVITSPLQTRSLSPNDLAYAEDFDRYAFDYYTPHVTLGYGELREELEPFSFLAKVKLGLLGEHCTIAKLI